MNKKYFLAAMYLRLSRDDSDVGDVTDKDGRLKSESNSIGNQRELIRAFIHEQQDIELYDIYVDDGFSGSNLRLWIFYTLWVKGYQVHSIYPLWLKPPHPPFSS